MEFVGLLFELVLLGIGLYLYLFALGKISSRGQDPEFRKRAEAFRNRNGWWLRLAGLALMAISLVNLALHLSQLLGG